MNQLVKKLCGCSRILSVIAALLSATVLPAARLSFHEVRVDRDNHVLPWHSDEPGTAYDHILKLLWFYWRHVPAYFDCCQPDGKPLGAVDLPKYMVYRTLENRGIGGDQFAMMLSSWAAYYQYTGDPALLMNMVYQADTYLAHSLSPTNAVWPNLPYPCNTEPKLQYDGDLVLGKDITQPDKAGSLGAELITLFKMTGDFKYLDAAVNIADVLAAKTKPGDADHSPLPFKVNALTGEVRSAYTTNWTGTLRLFQDLISLQKGNADQYKVSFGQILEWLKTYPIQNNKWGPFFEDIPGWSDTQINASTLAWYLMVNKSWDPNWKHDVRHIQDWVIQKLGNKDFGQQIGVLTINEQTACAVPGQSHTSRHASVELRYAAETGDERNKEMAIRQLNWATYFVDDDGKNRYPDPKTYEIWWTDGYGDFVRHYLRAMATDPELAPSGQNHILDSSSVVRDVKYAPDQISYKTFDENSTETLRLVRKPLSVLCGDTTLNDARTLDAGGWSWKPIKSSGVLQVHHVSCRQVAITIK